MAMSKITAYLKAREGQEVSYEEIAGAGLAPSSSTLNTDLARLVASPGSGVTRIGDERRPGVRRGYRYDTPKPPEPLDRMSLLLVGFTQDGHGLAEDEETGRLFELAPVGRLHHPIRQDGGA